MADLTPNYGTLGLQLDFFENEYFFDFSKSQRCQKYFWPNHDQKNILPKKIKILKKLILCSKCSESSNFQEYTIGLKIGFCLEEIWHRKNPDFESFYKMRPHTITWEFWIKIALPIIPRIWICLSFSIKTSQMCWTCLK